MRVVAVDPGYDRLGVAVMEYQNGSEILLYSTCIETDRKATLPERLSVLGNAFAQILADYSPDTVAIETLFFNKNITTAIGVAEARGVIVYLAREATCAVYEFGPQEVKIAVTGYGASTKPAVYQMIERLIPTVPKNARDDEYDAIAVGITCLAQHGRNR
jgi:crossover junction endodeoxyribonuclease RuvC